MKDEDQNQTERLRGAIREDHVLLYFQPILDCRSGAIMGYEARARLKQPNGNIVWAESCLETLKRDDLPSAFDRAVLGKAFQMQSACRGANCTLEKPKMFINLSAAAIESPTTLGYAEDLGERLRLPAGSIVFEIAERDALRNINKMRAFITRLRDKGFGFMLADYGNAHNFFNILRELHFDYAKIDGALVRNLLNNKIDYALVNNLLNRCRDLDIGTIAEYVENKETFETLCAMGVDYAQGYYLGLPHPMMDCCMYYPPIWNTDASAYHKCPVSLKTK